MRLIACVAVSLALIGCFISSDEDGKLVSVTLASTRLTGDYNLIDYLFEYGDGLRLDPSILKVTGTLEITGDSTYTEGIRVGNDSTTTRGRITQVKTRAESKDIGELHLTLESTDDTGSASAGKSDFSFRGDTLVLVTEVSKERDAAKKGFRETAYYLRNTAAFTATGD